MSTVKDVLYCFIDTDVLLHFRTFDEINWPEILKARSVCLVFAPSVLRELNQHKDDSSNGWRQKRARTLVSKLRDLLESGTPGNSVEMRSGVSLLDIAKEPTTDWAALGLDPSIDDDRFIASVLESKNELKSGQVIMLSNDFLAQRKARRYGIHAVNPAGLIDPIDRSSPEEARIRQLEQQIRTLESRLPRLALAFDVAGGTTNTFVSKKVVQPITETSRREISDHFGDIAQKRHKMQQHIENARRMGVDDQKIQRFTKEYSGYLSQLDNILEMRRSFRFGQCCRLNLILNNSGSAPAQDVKVVLEFPEHSFVISEHLAPYPELFFLARNEPKPDWLNKSDALRFLAHAPLVTTDPIEATEEKDISGPVYDDLVGSNRFHFINRKVRQAEPWNLGPLIAYLRPEVDEGFEIHYTIYCDDLPNSITGHLNVAFD